MESNNRFIENQEIRKRIETILDEEEFKILPEDWRNIDNWYFNKFRLNDSRETEEKLLNELKEILLDKNKYDSFVYKGKSLLEEILIDVQGINFQVINSNSDLYHQYQMLANMDYLYINNDNIGNIHLLNHATKSFFMDIDDPFKLRALKRLSLLHEQPEYIQQACHYFITLERMKMLQYYFRAIKGLLLKINYNFTNLQQVQGD